MESIRFKGSHQSIDALTLSVTDHKIAFPSSAIADNSKIKFPRSFGDMLPLFLVLSSGVHISFSKRSFVIFALIGPMYTCVNCFVL